MEIVFLIVGVAIGAGLVLLALRPRLRSLVVQSDRAGELDRELVQARSDLSHERERAAERLATLQDAQRQLGESFKALSVEALESSMKQLTEMARAQLQTAQVKADGELEQRRQAVEQLVGPIKEQLGRVDTRLLALDQERRESRGRLEAQLRSLAEAGERLRVETGALVTALRKPNTRGQWGQMQLRNVVEAAGMIRHCDFFEQSALQGDDSTLRPDLIINMPGGKHVVVDAKAPLQGVLDAYEATDEAERAAHLRDHARLLRRHVKQLADKAYWSRLDSTPDFVVMFLPGEHLYGAALDADPALLEDAMAQRVVIATPTTLLALLHTIGYGWQQERIAVSAQAVSELGRELHARLVKLSSLLSTLGTKLNGAVRAYNDAIGSYEARVLPGARRFAENGVVSESSELPELERVTLSARRVQLAEQQMELGGAVSPNDEIAARRLHAAD
jgi:DNA recombination protein RmuC